MSDLHLVDCVNCGKQTMIDLKRPEDTCQFCGKNARKKEDIMQDNKERTPVPLKPQKKSNRMAYLNQNKEAIVADYGPMPLRAFLERWHICTTTWVKLKKLWAITNKTRRTFSSSKPGVEGTQKGIKETASQDVALTEHERYLILLGYQQAVREFLKHLQ